MVSAFSIKVLLFISSGCNLRLQWNLLVTQLIWQRENDHFQDLLLHSVSWFFTGGYFFYNAWCFDNYVSNRVLIFSLHEECKNHPPNHPVSKMKSIVLRIKKYEWPINAQKEKECQDLQLSGKLLWNSILPYKKLLSS